MIVICNQCMELFDEDEIITEVAISHERSCAMCVLFDGSQCYYGHNLDPDGCEDYDPAEMCPSCGAVGCLMDMEMRE